jgi:hypothetical protein
MCMRAVPAHVGVYCAVVSRAAFPASISGYMRDITCGIKGCRWLIYNPAWQLCRKGGIDGFKSAAGLLQEPWQTRKHLVRTSRSQSRRDR